MPSVRTNVVWALVGNVGYAACQWGVLVVLAKLTSPADVGRFALGLALAAPAMIFSGLLLRTLQATDARREYPFGVYLGLRLMTTAAALVAVWVAVVLGGYDAATRALVMAIALAKAFESVSDVVFGLLQQHENLRRVASSMLIKGILSLAAMASVLALGGGVLAATLAMAAAWGVVLAVYDVPAAGRLASLRPAFADGRVGRLAWLAFPMGAMAGLQSLTTSVPRYAIEASLGATSLGYFAALAYLLTAPYQPVLALWTAVSPRLARHFAHDVGAFRTLSLQTLALAAGLGVVTVAGATLFGETLLRVAYAPAYAEHAPVLVWLAVAGGVGYLSSALGASITAARRLRCQPVIAAVALAVSAGASSVLVPRYGLVGAAWAVLAACTTQAASLAVIFTIVCAAPGKGREIRGVDAIAAEGGAA